MITDTTPILRVDKLSKSFGDTCILKGVSLSLRKGEIKVLIGPSGGGKSTLLQCINCLIPPDAGEIHLGEDQIDLANKSDLYRLRQQVGMIFQDFNLFDHLNALDNITIALRKVKGIGKREATERALLELEQVGLGDKADALSGPAVAAARNSGSPLPGPWPWTPRPCSWTNRPRRSIRN